MATDPDFIDYAAEQIALGNRLSHKKMFGEYALYVDGKVVAFACDNSLFVKPSVATDTLAPELPRRPPYPGAKDYPVADELLDDSDRLRQLILETAALMPVPKPRAAAGDKRKPKR
ncbi:TfoX/Sxy family protein [Dyella agri]|uniref:TfoX/Sxy family protein n=1 Tax=Dyella agri TaxID=1926869 RepID=A0ABW8KHD2_9GAMM